MRLDATGILALAALAAVGVLGVLLWRNPDWINPASDKNFGYRLAGGAVEAVTSGRETTAGGLLAWAREWASGTDDKIEAMKKGSAKTALPPLPNPRDAR